MSDYFIDKIMLLVGVFFLLYLSANFLFNGRKHIRAKYSDNKKKQDFYLRLGWIFCIISILCIVAVIVLLIFFP